MVNDCDKSIRFSVSAKFFLDLVFSLFSLFHRCAVASLGKNMLESTRKKDAALLCLLKQWED